MVISLLDLSISSNMVGKRPLPKFRLSFQSWRFFFDEEHDYLYQHFKRCNFTYFYAWFLAFLKDVFPSFAVPCAMFPAVREQRITANHGPITVAVPFQVRERVQVFSRNIRFLQAIEVCSFVRVPILVRKRKLFSCTIFKSSTRQR